MGYNRGGGRGWIDDSTTRYDWVWVTWEVVFFVARFVSSFLMCALFGVFVFYDESPYFFVCIFLKKKNYQWAGSGLKIGGLHFFWALVVCSAY